MRPRDVADQFPNTKFAITDYSVERLQAEAHERRGPDVRDAAEQLPRRLPCGAKVASRAGQRRTSASSAASRSRRSTRSSPATGQARRSACAGTTVQIGYSQDFIDQAKCKSVAQNQIDAGSQVVFDVAGPCGLGALDAAKEAGRWGVGVDVDQSYLGNHILTSAVKRVDTGIFLAVKGAKTGKGFRRGGNLVFNLKNSGVALGKISKKAKIPKAWIDADQQAEGPDHRRQDQAARRRSQASS